MYGLRLRTEPGRHRYIGKTSALRGVKYRVYSHFWLAENSSGNLPVQRWILKHGKENIVFDILEESTTDKLSGLEVSWIKTKRLLGQADLNVTAGGDGRDSEDLVGDKNPRAKLTWDQVREIRSVAQTRYLYSSEASKTLGVTPAAASKILTNRTWVDSDYEVESRIHIGDTSTRGEQVTAWGRPSDQLIELYRSRYLSGETPTQLSRIEGVPLTTMRRYLFDKYASEESLKECVAKRGNP